MCVCVYAYWKWLQASPQWQCWRLFYHGGGNTLRVGQGTERNKSSCVRYIVGSLSRQGSQVHVSSWSGLDVRFTNVAVGCWVHKTYYVTTLRNTDISVLQNCSCLEHVKCHITCSHVCMGKLHSYTKDKWQCGNNRKGMHIRNSNILSK